MIDRSPQGVSPVIARNTLAPGNVFSGVKGAALDRLQFTVENHNSLPNTIAQGRATAPIATASNDMAARVTDFDPKPGRQPRMGMHMQVHSAPGSQVDNVIDAIQRYLNISPRREPSSDPKAEDSIARHPQQIIQGAARWAETDQYQFSINGARSVQYQPEMHRWGGSLSADVVEPGLTGIAAPATREPQPGRRRNTRNEFNHVFAAQTAMRDLRQRLDKPDVEIISVGAGGYSDRPYNDPETAYANAINRTAENMAQPDILPIVTVGKGGYSDQPGNQPTVALQASIDRTHRNLMNGGAAIADDYEAPTLASQKTVQVNMENMSGPEKPEIITVGAGDMFQSIHKQPQQAGISGAHAAVNLIAEPGTNLHKARVGALDQAYLRALHIMRGQEDFRLATHVVGRQA